MFSQSTRRICPPSRASYRAPLGVKICKYVYLYYASTNMYFIRSRAAPTLRNVVGDIRDEDGRNKRRRAWARACSGTGTGETPGHQNLMRPQWGSPGLGAYAANAGACAPSVLFRIWHSSRPPLITLATRLRPQRPSYLCFTCLFALNDHSTYYLPNY